MTCPLCRQRRARRSCPALGESICPVCCGTKRLVEIRCPETCPYLSASREHPPASVQKQQQRDVTALLETMQGLSEPQQQMLFVLLGVVRSQHGDPLRPLRDEDVAEAAEALASTLETAARGVIYERQAQSLPAQRLLTDLKAELDEVGAKVGGRAAERDGAHALRALERGAREIGRVLDRGPTSYLDLVARLLRPPVAGVAEPSIVHAPEAGRSGLILPPD
jgi:SpoVK/Ycf46/Vps4 family AAA+-type ATPase